MFCLWQPTGRLKGQVCRVAYELAATWCWATFTQRGPKVNSRIWLCALGDSTINNILVYYYIIIIFFCLSAINNIFRRILSMHLHTYDHMYLHMLRWKPLTISELCTAKFFRDPFHPCKKTQKQCPMKNIWVYGVRTLISGRRTFPDLCKIYSSQVTTLWVKWPLWVG